MPLLFRLLAICLTLWLGPGAATMAVVAQDPAPDPGSGEQESPPPRQPPVEEHGVPKLEKPHDSDLIVAIRNDDDDRIVALLAAGADVNAPGDHGRTPLMYAASAGRVDLMSTLLAAGARVDSTDDSGNTVLFFLPPRDDPEPVRLLLDHGARAAVENHVGYTPLRSAALLGYTTVLGLLLRSGDSIDDDACREALVQAVLHHRFDAAKQLLLAGTDVDPSLGHGRDLLYSLAETGDSAGVRFLIDRGADVDLRMGACCPGETPLMAAAKSGQLAAAAELLSRGAQLEATSETGYTPLLLAARHGHASVAVLLLDHGAEVDRLGGEETESTPLIMAAMEGHGETVRVLLAHGASIDARNRSGNTALMFASFRGAVETVRLLLDHGADVNAANRDARTALLFAVIRGPTEVVRILLERSAGVDVKTRIEGFGEVTPLMLAAGQDHPEIAQALLDHGASVDTPTHVEDLGLVTPLMLAAREGHAAIVRALLAAGADPSFTQPDGDSALLWAREQDHTEVVALLEAASLTP